jgi:thiol-disulfide isomerase/thioredoxin
MRLGNIENKYYGFALWGIVIILVVSNGLWLRQNLQLRNLLKRFEPDQLKTGDKLESFAAPGLHGGNIAIDFTSNAPRRVLLFFSPDCPYCREQFPFWKRIIDMAPGKGFQLVAVAMNSEDKSNPAAYLRSMGCPSRFKDLSRGSYF